MRARLLKTASVACAAFVTLAGVTTTAQAADDRTSLAEDRSAIESLSEDDIAALRDGEDPSLDIVGGDEATRGAYPWMVKVVIKTEDGYFGCGGTIVSDDIVVTAQHCTDGAESIDVFYGSNEWRYGRRVSVADRVEGNGPGRGDWSVLKTSRDMYVNEMPVVAEADDANYGPEFRALGWGALWEDGPSSETLMEVDLDFVDDRQCRADSNEICAGDWFDGERDTCQGDSGGPLVNLAYGRPVLVGITSWGYGCASAYNPGHYTEVSTYFGDITNAIETLGGEPLTAFTGE